jgi:hypothetical protein
VSQLEEAEFCVCLAASTEGVEAVVYNMACGLELGASGVNKRKTEYNAKAAAAAG